MQGTDPVHVFMDVIELIVHGISFCLFLEVYVKVSQFIFLIQSHQPFGVPLFIIPKFKLNLLIPVPVLEYYSCCLHVKLVSSPTHTAWIQFDPDMCPYFSWWKAKSCVLFLQSLRVFKSTFSVHTVINLVQREPSGFMFFCCVLPWLHPEIWEGASERHREVCWSHKMAVLESVYGLSSLSRHRHWSAPSNYSAGKMLLIPNALNPLLAHTHIQNTLHWCLDYAVLVPLRCIDNSYMHPWPPT